MWHIIETTEDYKCMIATNAKVIFLFAPMHGESGYLNLLNKNPDYEASTKDENNCDVVFAIVDKDKFPDLYHQNGFTHEYSKLTLTNPMIIFLFTSLDDYLNMDPRYKTHAEADENKDIFFAIVDINRFPSLYRQSGLRHVLSFKVYRTLKPVKGPWLSLGDITRVVRVL
ncbi:hypothetical protein BGX23_001238 [Mortierella sp. AD031]|nr:hypothetical protein BGX23_001238 [Mortierella sp. AD031]